MNLNPAVASASPAADDHLRKGTLLYTRRTLMVLFFYLLWGDFAFQLMEMVAPAILPLQLKDLGASNFTMGVLLSTIPAFFNFAMNPIVSFRSDNLRTAWGRRKPLSPPPLSSLSSSSCCPSAPISVHGWAESV